MMQKKRKKPFWGKLTDKNAPREGIVDNFPEEILTTG